MMSFCKDLPFQYILIEEILDPSSYIIKHVPDLNNPNNESNQFFKLHEEINNHFYKHDVLQDHGSYIPSRGENVAVFSPKDHNWWRGTIKDLYDTVAYSNSAQVYFIDTGKTILVPNKNIRKAEPWMFALPAQAKHFKLFGLVPRSLEIRPDPEKGVRVESVPSEKWNPSALKRINELLKGNSLVMVKILKGLNKDKVLQGFLYVQNKAKITCVNEFLVKEGLAVFQPEKVINDDIHSVDQCLFQPLNEVSGFGAIEKTNTSSDSSHPFHQLPHLSPLSQSSNPTSIKSTLPTASLSVVSPTQTAASHHARTTTFRTPSHSTSSNIHHPFPSSYNDDEHRASKHILKKQEQSTPSALNRLSSSSSNISLSSSSSLSGTESCLKEINNNNSPSLSSDCDRSDSPAISTEIYDSITIPSLCDLISKKDHFKLRPQNDGISPLQRHPSSSLPNAHDSSKTQMLQSPLNSQDSPLPPSTLKKSPCLNHSSEKDSSSYAALHPKRVSSSPKGSLFSNSGTRLKCTPSPTLHSRLKEPQVDHSTESPTRSNPPLSESQKTEECINSPEIIKNSSSLESTPDAFPHSRKAKTKLNKEKALKKLRKVLGSSLNDEEPSNEDINSSPIPLHKKEESESYEAGKLDASKFRSSTPIDHKPSDIITKESPNGTTVSSSEKKMKKKSKKQLLLECLASSDAKNATEVHASSIETNASSPCHLERGVDLKNDAPLKETSRSNTTGSPVSHQDTAKNVLANPMRESPILDEFNALPNELPPPLNGALSIRSHEDFAHLSSGSLDTEPMEKHFFQSFINDKELTVMGQLARILSFGSNPNATFFELDDFTFEPQIKKRLEKLNFQVPTNLQAHMWGSVLRLVDIMCIGPGSTGKTLGYLVPLLSQLIVKEDYATLPESFGPIVLIIASSWRRVERIQAQSQILLAGIKPNLKVLSHYKAKHLKDENYFVFWENGVDLAIFTPNTFLDELEHHPVPMELLKRCCHLVLDDGDRLLEFYPSEVKKIVLLFLEAYNIRKKECKQSEATPFQTIVASEYWTSQLARFNKKWLKSPQLFFTSFWEGLVYVNLPFHIHICSSTATKRKLLELLNQAQLKTKVVCTKSSQAALELQEFLKSESFITTLAHENMPHYELREICLEFNRKLKHSGRSVLIVTDGVLLSMKIYKASCLVNYDLAETSYQFGLRLSTLQDHFLAANRNVEIHTLLTENDSHEALTLVRFLQRLNQDPPVKLKEMAKDYLWRTRTQRPLCHFLKCFGKCPDIKKCFYRHDVLTHLDQPSVKDIWEGKTVKFHVTKVVTASRMYARLQSDSCNALSLALSMKNHFLRAKPRTPFLGQLVVGQIYAVEKESGLFVRAEVLEENTTESQVKVFFIDEGLEGWVPRVSLLELPKHLLSLPRCSVEVIGCHLEPPDVSLEWTPAATKLIQESFTDKVLDGKVVFCLGHTLWVDPLVYRPQFTALHYAPTLMNFAQMLKDENVAVPNPDHIAQLKKLCGSRIIFPTGPSKGDITVDSKAPPSHALPPQIAFAFLDTTALSSVVLSHVISPGLFFVQQQKFLSCLDDLQKDVEKLIEGGHKEVVTQLIPGSLGLAKYPLDNKWYRVQVKEVLSDMEVKVYFGDYGECFDVPKSEILALPPKLRLLPFQAIECSLYGVVPPEGSQDWAESAGDALYNLTHSSDEGEEDPLQKTLMVKVVIKKDESIASGGRHYIINAYDTSNPDYSISIANELVHAGEAEWHPDLTPEDLPLSFYEEPLPKFKEEDYLSSEEDVPKEKIPFSPFSLDSEELSGELINNDKDAPYTSDDSPHIENDKRIDLPLKEDGQKGESMIASTTSSSLEGTLDSRAVILSEPDENSELPETKNKDVENGFPTSAKSSLKERASSQSTIKNKVAEDIETILNPDEYSEHSPSLASLNHTENNENDPNFSSLKPNFTLPDKFGKNLFNAFPRKDYMENMFGFLNLVPPHMKKKLDAASFITSSTKSLSNTSNCDVNATPINFTPNKVSKEKVVLEPVENDQKTPCSLQNFSSSPYQHSLTLSDANPQCSFHPVDNTLVPSSSSSSTSTSSTHNPPSKELWPCLPQLPELLSVSSSSRVGGTWWQSRHHVTLELQIPCNLLTQNFSLEVGTQSLSLHSSLLDLDLVLFRPIHPELTEWSIQECRCSIRLTKCQPGTSWKSLVDKTQHEKNLMIVANLDHIYDSDEESVVGEISNLPLDTGILAKNGNEYKDILPYDSSSDEEREGSYDSEEDLDDKKTSAWKQILEPHDPYDVFSNSHFE